ncbi:hypothetical protein BH18THE2_BH18THE2_37530 [soil metagenome]
MAPKSLPLERQHITKKSHAIEILLPIEYTLQIALKILVAEDCPETAVMYKHVLEGRGHEVVIYK